MTASGPRLSGALGLCFCPVAVLVHHPEKRKSENSVCRVREGLHVGRRSPRSSAQGTNGVSRAQSVSHGNAAFGLRLESEGTSPAFRCVLCLQPCQGPQVQEKALEGPWTRTPGTPPCLQPGKSGSRTGQASCFSQMHRVIINTC